MKYRTINNHVARRLVRFILNESYSHFVTLLYNVRYDFEHDVFVNLIDFCIQFLNSSSFKEFISFVCGKHQAQYVWFREFFVNELSGRDYGAENN